MSGERFDEYMDRCLYGDTGFYSTGRGAGRGGRDFITSPEVGPLFGAVIARAVDALWDDLDQPDEFAVVEAAAGRGALAAAIFRATPRCGAALRYVTVERSDELRAAQLGLLRPTGFAEHGRRHPLNVLGHPKPLFQRPPQA